MPYFREGDYYLGLKSAINEIEKRILGEKEISEPNDFSSLFLLFTFFSFSLLFSLLCNLILLKSLHQE